MAALAPVTPQVFFDELLSSRAARRGEVVRRNVRVVERYVGREIFVREMRRRGYSVVENAGQFVIFCNSAPVRRIV
ncbi:N-(5'-phosphoribosyl)anthranilate isomerase [Pseudoroseicyclus tamaricis]|uniref:N-(5'-phosphoribosyl)anthranilate isomerase n=1 Tax=Pseudoroseicyclus tamaricis TaxID=2705421 RepID=A0A6B2K5D1_9RHOB|nr:N-(5'-phosphoribosyl)anthranilate isomerase [Pseudoroseicyclus tamaricis]NDV01966.1 N-(5'-phosphoribosyl)anthranilate isomerase [Pseudoroseicyclus tamaricis]